MRKNKVESHQDITDKESKNKNSDNLDSDFNQELVILRNKIDKIDKKILQSLQKRMLIVKDVKLLKEKYHNNFFIKSAREADMIKNLIAKMQLNHHQLELPLLPIDCIVDIWRKIISSANFIEQKLNIAIFKDKFISSY
jgi:chorismate mutase